MATETNQPSVPDFPLSPSEIVLLNSEKFATVKESNKNQSLIVMAFLLVFIIGSAWWAIYQWSIIKEIKQSQLWPTTDTGIVLSSEAVPQSESDFYDFNISYRFTTATGQVDSGYALQNEHLLSMLTASGAEELLDKYKIGSTVKVHYLPPNNESLLETDIKKSVVIFCLLGIFFCIIFSIGFVTQLKLFLKK
jgi:hypothetical protein